MHFQAVIPSCCLWTKCLRVTGAYNAGLDILDRLKDFNSGYLKKYFYQELMAGIGIHMGKVIIGNIGIGVNNNLTAMGMPVNIASRIQSATKDVNNNFLISDSTYQALEMPPASEQMQIELKGVKDSICVHLLGHSYT